MEREGESQTCDNSESSTILATTNYVASLTCRSSSRSIGSAESGRRRKSLKKIVMGGMLGTPEGGGRWGGQIGRLSGNLTTYKY